MMMSLGCHGNALGTLVEKSRPVLFCFCMEGSRGSVLRSSRREEDESLIRSTGL
uniref:Uncharacterized protein n=1 Tax=Anguilla anguilla TaxID=7936 RepID=A0A0E9TZV4_ANGAN